ncbi:MAG: CapA family protein [Patescibacteria group bacterium]|nr:CapA family protein [Patescibacteria group bacterium]
MKKLKLVKIVFSVFGFLAFVFGAVFYWRSFLRVTQGGQEVLAPAEISAGVERQDKGVSGRKEEREEDFLKREGKDEIKLLFVGDMMFDRWIREVIEKKGLGFVFSGAGDRLREVDLVVGNLEGPITDKSSVSAGTVFGDKRHMVFTFSSKVARGLRENNIRLVNLGNNHILNFGMDGLEETRRYLDAVGVRYFGNIGEASEDAAGGDWRRVIEEVDGVKIGFCNYNGFAAHAREKVLEDIEFLNERADLVVVYAHWDREYKKSPSGETRILAREFISRGADLVIGSHPHVIGEKENYQGKMIYYSLGNFIFDQYFSPETRRGLVVEVTIGREDQSMEFEEQEIFLEKDGRTVLKEKK